MKRLIAITMAVLLGFCFFALPSDQAFATDTKGCDHVVNGVITEEANCAHGNIWTFTCKKCGYSYIEDDGERTEDHQLIVIPAKEPTVEERGNIEHYKCTVCGRCFRINDPSWELGSSDIEIPRIGGEPVVTSVSCDKEVVNWMDTICFRIEYTSDEPLNSSITIHALGKNTNSYFEASPGSWEENTGLLRIENDFDPQTWTGSTTYYRIANMDDAIDEYNYYVSAPPYVSVSDSVPQSPADDDFMFGVRLFDGTQPNYYTSEDETLTDKLLTLQDGDIAVIKLYNNNTFKKEWLDAIQDKDVTIIIPYGNWGYATFKGNEIVNETKDIKVRFSMSGGGRADDDDGGPWFALEFTFPNNGTLPCKIRYHYWYDYVYDFVKEGIDSRIITADDVLGEMKLYYINNGMLVLEPDSISNSEDWLILELNHNSGFVASSFSPKIMRSFNASLSKTTFVYNGKIQKPTVKTDKKGCSIAYSNKESKSIGSYKVTVKAPSGGYGTQVLKYKIKPTKVTNLTLKSAKSKQIKITYKKANGGVKYQINYRVKGNKTWKKAYATGTSRTLKSLKGGKYYQVRVRAYKKVSGSTYYGTWSTIKSVKVKK